MSRPSGRRYGIVLAAGQGIRFGGLKQFARLRGRPLFYFSVMAFERCPTVIGFVLVVGESSVNAVRRVVRSWRLTRLMTIVAGGRTRADSVANGLAPLPSSGWVAIHDAARPLVTPAMLGRGFAACRGRRAAAYGIPVTDTLKRVRAGQIAGTVDRSALVAVQTPQFFDLRLLRRAYAARGRVRATDDCRLVERLGVKPLLLPGSARNIKVTTRTDLKLCAALL